jgi:hypothetical protein
MKVGTIRMASRGGRGPLAEALFRERESERIEFAVYAVVGASVLLAVVLHLAAPGVLGGKASETAATAGRPSEVIGLQS